MFSGQRSYLTLDVNVYAFIYYSFITLIIIKNDSNRTYKNLAIIQDFLRIV